jgi:hypothetical protein
MQTLHQNEPTVMSSYRHSAAKALLQTADNYVKSGGLSDDARIK